MQLEQWKLTMRWVFFSNKAEEGSLRLDVNAAVALF
jgi:hypothetical protein